MPKEKLSYREITRRFEIRADKRIAAWEGIYLTEEAEGFLIERRGRGSKGRPAKLGKKVEEDLISEMQRLRTENAYRKNWQAMVLEDERRHHKKRW